jgi:hypothetical protein
MPGTLVNEYLKKVVTPLNISKEANPKVNIERTRYVPRMQAC